MKRFLYTLFAVLAFFACSDSGTDNGGGQEKPKQPEFTLNATNVDFTTEGGTDEITFTSSTAWTAEVVNSRADAWCSINPTSGPAGAANITVTTKENDTPDDRTASIIIKAGTASKTITVSQKQKDAITITSSKFEVDAEGGEVQIDIKANVEFEYSIEESAKEWVSYRATRALKSTSLVFDIAKNEEFEKREAKIHITNGHLEEIISIYQSAAKPSIIISQDEHIVSSNGETIAVEVKSNVDVNIEIPSEIDWISENTTRAYSTNTYHFDIMPHEGYDQRSAEIKFTNKANGLSEAVKIVQMQKNALLVAADNYDINPNGGYLEFNIQTNTDFEVSTNVDWIKQVETRGLTEHTLCFDIAENVFEKREGVISIFAGECKQEITINQEGNNLPFSIKQKEYILPLEGCQFLVEINYDKPYKVKFNDSEIRDERNIIIKNTGYDKLIFTANSTTSETVKEIIISDEAEITKDTIQIIQRKTDEYLHCGHGNSGHNSYGVTVPYFGITLSDDVYTNLNDYEVLVYGNTDTHQVKYLNRERTNFGFKEFFEIPHNDTNKNLTFKLIYIGNNITFIKTVNVSRQLFVNFEEDGEIYIPQEGGTFTTHAWTEDNNLNIRLEGSDTSWLTVKNTDDTYIDGVRRINTTFEATPNQTGKTREVSVIAYNGFNDNDVVRVIQPSGESVLLSNEKLYAGAWEKTYELLIKKCDYTLSIDGQASWLTYGVATEKNGALSIPINIDKYDGETEREATIVVKSGNITNKVYVHQLPESGALIDDSDPKWKSFQLPQVKFETPYPNSKGSLLYHAIVEDPKELIAIQSRRVLNLLYFSPDEPLIPRRDVITYKLDNYNGISAFYSDGNNSGIILSNQYIESYYNQFGVKALVAENKGVLSHELTHSFQLEPQGVGDYNSSQVFHACIEGMADAVRVLSGGFPNESDRPKGGSYLDSYRYTGFFIAWLVNNKDKDFLRKFNMSTQYVVPWSFDGAIKYALGEQYNVDDLWLEYQRAMGDIR